MSMKINFESVLFDDHLRKVLTDKPFVHLCLDGLDALLGGVRPRLTVICGEPAAGKTTLLHQLADELASKKTPVLFFSFEIATPPLVGKSIVRLSEGTLSVGSLVKNEQGSLTDHLHSAIQRYRSEVAPHIAIIENLTDPIEIGALVSACERETGFKPIVFIDYVQLLPSQSDQTIVDERLAIKSSMA